MSFQENGFSIINSFLSQQEINELSEAIEQELGTLAHKSLRNPELKSPTIAALAKSSKIIKLVDSIFNKPYHLVRIIYFNKSQENNWAVSWHQDRTIAVSQKIDLKNWGPWTIKDNKPHVQPPKELLEEMLTLRLHLDKAEQETGCLKVIPSSHKLGILNAHEIQSTTTRHTEHYCSAKSGDLLIMKPLLLHASSKSTSPHSRRVIHLEFCAATLPNELSW